MSDSIDMRVTKRDGELEDIAFDKILTRVKKLGQEANIQINYSALVMKVIDQLYDKIPTTKIDELTAEQCAVMSTQHPDYAVLAGRVVVSNHQKNTESSFFSVVEKLYWYNDIHGNHSPLLSHEMWLVVNHDREELEEMIDYNRDYLIDYFGFKTLERAYLFKVNDVVVERPQHMWLRVAIGIHGDNMAAVKETYDLMSQKYFTHATPTLFNAGTPRPQLSSCYLIAMEDDSIDGIYNTLKDCAKISKWAGGIGLHIHNIRAKGTHIRGTNGKSNGIVPMLRVFNNTAKYVDQCVHPETIIYTTNGPTQIQNCSVGETKIYNLNGVSETIQNVLEHSYSGDFLEIESMHSIFPLRITPEHPIYVLKNQPKGLNYSLIKNRIQKNICTFEWVDAKDVNNTDWLVFPIPKEVIDITNITEEDCYMYGIILGDGSMNNHESRSGTITLHTVNKSHLKDFIVSYFERNYVNYTVRVDGNTTKIRWNRSIHLPFRYNDFYDDNKTKRVNHKWLNLPIQKCKYILKGLLETDGSYGKKELVFDNTSLNLIECVRFMCMKLGALTSGYIRDRVGEKHETSRGIIENKKISYTLRVPRTEEICELMDVEYDDEKQFFKFLRYGDYLLSRVQNVKTTKYEGILYDLQMEKEHNYLIHNGLVHNGGGKRNGSFAIYLETWHADIEDFLDMRKNHGDEELRARDLFYALWVSDLFMERVKENGKWSLFCPHECPGLADVYGDNFKELYIKYEESGKSNKIVNARELWFKILDAQMETGTPYLLYKDAANNKSNQKNIGTIKSSNLCVAPETQILTDNGYYEIQSLHNQKVNVWNGEEFSEVTIHKTGENQELIDIYTSDGCKLSCTKYHKFYIQTKYCSSKSKSNNNIVVVEAQNLKEGDKIIKCDFPVIDNEKEMKYAYTHGFFCGDGTYNNNVESEQQHRCNFKSLIGHSYCKRHIDFENEKNTNEIQTDKTNYICNATSYLKKPTVSLYGEKIDLLKHLNYRSCGEVDDKLKKLNVQLPLDIEEKFTVPQHFSLKTKLEWFSGLCDADGTISKNGDNQQLQVSSIEEEFLLNVKFMLQTCGINPKVTKMCGESKKLLPDSNRNLKLYDCKSVYRLLVTSNDLQKLVKLGFEPKRLKINEHTPNRNANQFIKIVSVQDKGRIDDTYCFNEPKKNSGIFNGIITSQCTEIMEYSDDKETAVCNLASIALPAFVNEETKEFDYEQLHKVAKVVTGNLNRIIDINFYPTPKTKRSNLLHRPIGIGIQGLADTFIMMDIPFHSEQAKEVNKLIFETIYHAALERSNEIAVSRKEVVTFIHSKLSESDLNNIKTEFNLEDDVTDYLKIQESTNPSNSKVIAAELIKFKNEKLAGSYSSFVGSPASQGNLQFDLWGITPTPNRYDWNLLKELIKEYGLRNSLLIAPMPTASTSQILGYNECFEPLTSNLYTRRTLAGEFVVANKYLMKDLISLGLWNEKIKNNIIANKGSVQQLTVLPEHIRNKYKIVWEMPMKHLIDMAGDRGAFICQSQSLNLWLEDPNYNTLTSMHFYSWKMGLKTGIYYLRRKAKHQAQQFTVEPEKRTNQEENDEICEMCSA
jgi:ribonucleoside-diphosphate reductase alpha chain